MVRPRERSLGTLDERSLLAGVHAARLAVASALVVAATVVGTTTPAAAASPLSIVVVVAGVATVWTLGSILFARRRPISRRFLLAQVVHDLVLTTTAVVLTGGVGSEFVLMYVLLIAGSGLLLGFRVAMGTAAVCVVVYLTIAYLQIAPTLDAGGRSVALPNLSGQVTAIAWSIALTLAVFVLVGFASGIAGRRLVAQRERLTELESQLAQSRFDAQDILNTIESGILSIDVDERIVFVNRTARRLLGIPGVAGDPRPPAGDHEGLKRLYDLLLETVRTGAEVEYAETLLDAADEARTVSVTTTVVYDPVGNKTGAAAILRDIEHVKRLEELVRQADRLKAVNELAAGLAHEVQNPMAAIRSAVELLGAEAADDRDRDRLMSLILRETDRLTELISDFKAFSGMKIREPQRVDLVAVVEDALEVDRITNGERGGRAAFAAPAEPQRVAGDHNLLKQVCLNLLSNARAATDDRPQPRIEVRLGGEVSIPDLERAGPFVALTVGDNGVGIDPEVRDRIFDPFFTTRTGGFGMGLAIVHRIVELHGGMVWVDSAPDRGATFHVALPRTE